MFKRCNYPRAGPNEDPQNPPRPPLGEHGGNAQMAESSGAALLVASAAFAAKQEYQSVDEDPLFSTAVNGLMALFGGDGAAAAPGFPTGAVKSSTPPASIAPDVPYGGATEVADGASATTRAPSPLLLGGIGAIVLNGKKMRSARCGQCRGCNSGDCGKCINCVDKPKFGGPGCRKQACTAIDRQKGTFPARIVAL